MNRILRFCSTAALALSVTLAPAAAAEETDAEVAARSAALDFASAFSNDGFKIRYGAQSGSASKVKPALVRVNLFAGNEYWFSAAAAGAGDTLTVRIYDEGGQLVDADTVTEGNRSAAGISPGYSGSFFIEISGAGDNDTQYCLVYSYK